MQGKGLETMITELTEDARFPDRGAMRIRILAGSKVALRDQGQVHVELKDISDRGFRAEGQDMPIGSELMLFVPGNGWMLACVRWSLGRKFGARFEQPIDMVRFWAAQSEAKGEAHARLVSENGAATAA